MFAYDPVGMAALLTWDMAGRVAANQKRQIAALPEPSSMCCACRR